MRTLYLTVSNNPTKVVFDKPMQIRWIKIDKAVLSLNYKNLTEKAHIKTTSARVDFLPGFLSFKELQMSFDKLGAVLTLEEYTQKAILKAPPASAITTSDNLRDLLGSDTKLFQAASLTTMANTCDILNGLKYFVLRCKEINGSKNLTENESKRLVETDILGLMGIKSFVFLGGSQYHDGNDFIQKERIETAFFNNLTFSLSGNNDKPVGEVFSELLLSYKINGRT